MAQVTMTGKEYVDLMNRVETAERQLLEISEWVVSDRNVNFPEDLPTWRRGEWSTITTMPQCLRKCVLDHVARCLKHLPEDEFKRWVESDAHYYSPNNNALSLCNSAKDSVDLLEEYEELREFWEEFTYTEELDG